MKIKIGKIRFYFIKEYFALCFWIHSLECRYHWIYIDLKWFQWNDLKSISILKLSKERYNKPKLTLSILDRKIF